MIFILPACLSVHRWGLHSYNAMKGRHPSPSPVKQTPRTVRQTPTGEQAEPPPVGKLADPRARPGCPPSTHGHTPRPGKVYPHPPRILWDTVNKRAVRILLECILVHFDFACVQWIPQIYL